MFNVTDSTDRFQNEFSTENLKNRLEKDTFSICIHGVLKCGLLAVWRRRVHSIFSGQGLWRFRK